MKHAIYFILYSLLLTACSTSNPRFLNGERYQLVWNDEFEGSGPIDKNKWSYDVGGHGWGNNELQYYTSENLKNARKEKGKLIIEAHKEEKENSKYTSARLVTKGKGDWQYGKIEVRAKLPKGRGTWPAIWMLNSKINLNWPEDGEIDIMEHVGFDPGVIHATVHTNTYNHMIGTQKSAQKKVMDFRQNFHRYQLTWEADKITMGIDDEVFYTFRDDGQGKNSWPFYDKFHLLLNIALGGGWGGQKGVDESIFPQRMEVDYVRVWQKK